MLLTTVPHRDIKYELIGGDTLRRGPGTEYLENNECVKILCVSVSVSMCVSVSVCPDEKVSLSDGKWEDIHVTAGALKMYFRELPEPLFTFSSFHDFVGAISTSVRRKHRYHRLEPYWLKP